MKIEFHDNHIVICPKLECQSILMLRVGTLLYSNSNREQRLKCFECGFSFVCCRSKRYMTIKNELKKLGFIGSKKYGLKAYIPSCS